MSIARTRIEDRIGISTHFMPSTHGETILDAIRMVVEAGFGGYEIVPTLGLLQLGVRFYDAGTGRFTQRGRVSPRAVYRDYQRLLDDRCVVNQARGVERT